MSRSLMGSRRGSSSFRFRLPHIMHSSSYYWVKSNVFVQIFFVIDNECDWEPWIAVGTVAQGRAPLVRSPPPQATTARTTPHPATSSYRATISGDQPSGSTDVRRLRMQRSPCVIPPFFTNDPAEETNRKYRSCVFNLFCFVLHVCVRGGKGVRLSKLSRR